MRGSARRLRWVGVLAAVLVLASGCGAPVPPSLAVLPHLPPRAPTPPTAALETGPPAPGPTAAGLAAAIAQALEQARPGWQAVVEGEDWVELWQGDQAGPAVMVAPVYAAVRRSPDESDALVVQAVASALWRYDHAGTWDQAREHILPRLVSVESLQALTADGAMPVNVPVTGDMVLVFDMTVDGRTFLVDEGIAVAWGQSDVGVAIQARQNLDADTGPLLPGPDGVWQFPETDGHSAARLLLTNRFKSLGTGPLAIAVPSSSSIFVFRADDRGLLERMRARTEADYGHAQDPLVTGWFQWQGGTLSPFPTGG